MHLSGRAKHLAKRMATATFFAGDTLGLHLLPAHFYTPVPNRKWLLRNKQLWARRVDLTGVEWDIDRQLSWLRSIAGPYYAEVEGLQAHSALASSQLGSGYGPIESQVLHCFVRALRPRRIIEVGSGVSTACVLSSVRQNVSEGHPATTITCIEPYPHMGLSRLPGVSLVASVVQAVPIDSFGQLGPGDLLFIDSSHAVKTGSDVLYLYLEVLPRLAPGVIVHIDDIFLPYLHQRDVLDTFFYWQETALLLALLKGNSRMRTLCCLSALHYDRTEELKSVLSDYKPQESSVDGLANRRAPGHFPSSFYLTIT